MPYKILLVDDSPEDRETCRRSLSRDRKNSYEVFGAATIGDGLDLYRRQTPDLILLDSLLPDGTWSDFIEKGGREIRCPIVVLTEQENERIAVETIGAGAVDYLVKGDLNPSLLNRIVRSAIERHALVQELETRREEERLIAALALRVRESLNLADILNATVTEVREFIGADRVLIYRFNPDWSGTIVAEAVIAPWRESARERVEDTYFQGKGGENYIGDRITAVADIETAGYSECYLELLQRFGVRANVVVPLLVGTEEEGESKRLWGLLVVHQCSRPRQWRESEIHCLQQLSIQLDIAIHQTELYEKIRQANERLEKTVALRTEELARTQEKLNLIIEGSGDGVWYFDILADTMYLSPRYRQFLGYEGEPDVWPWEKVRDLLHPEDGEALWNSHLRYLESGAPGIHEFEFRQRCKNGEYKDFYARGKAILDGTGRALFMAGTSTDITERKQLEDSLFQEKELAEITLRSIGDCVVTTDSLGRITYLNPVAETLLGLTGQEAAGQPLTDIFSLLDETTRSPIANPVELVLQDKRVTRLAEGTILVTRDGREYAVADSAAPILDRAGELRGTVLILNDVTESRGITRQLRERAERDTLTGLFNRFYFERQLEEAIAGVRGDPSAKHILCYLDLDKFKLVNDTCGHAAGDELLRQLSDLLKTHIRSTDTLARLGGDEFALLLYRCSLAKGRAIAERIVNAVREFPFTRDGKVFRVGVSVGLVAFDGTVENSEKLALAADAACYAAKEAGRNRVHVYREREDRLTRTPRERQWV